MILTQVQKGDFLTNSSIVYSLQLYGKQTFCDYCAFIVSSVSIQLDKQGYIDSAPDMYSRDLKIIVQVVCITYDNYRTNFLISFPTTALCIYCKMQFHNNERIQSLVLFSIYCLVLVIFPTQKWLLLFFQLPCNKEIGIGKL